MLQHSPLTSSQPVSLWTCQKDALAFQFHQEFPRLFPTQRRFSGTFKTTSLLLLLLSPSYPIAVASVACGLFWLVLRPRWQQSQPFARGWYEHRLDANPTALDVYAQHESSIRIVDSLYDLFLPSKNKDSVVALVFLPGALVDARAYAGVCHKLRQEGNNLAVILLQTDRYRRLMSPFFGLNEHALRDVMKHATNELAQANCSVRNWALGGHSLGGLTAQELLPKMPEISQLVLWGVNYPRATPISPTVTELVVTASQDGFRFSDPPPSTPEIQRYEIKGGNHGGFGDYPHQTYPRPDGTRTISLTEQHEQVARVTAQFLLS
ncbi:hypothetical protein FisN_29Lh021 [Fistulifera solaris]|uniref:Alpha/beta hydrolase fold-5 domain-containing protein n=1 Tax=Fistulifera solaris TaxID=1519565 RepID=A0A1Z5JLM7_FISSO|nr:hypothetical protein FisN_29Lh021 [Fistulifera solaris]|eukprot:GAX14816.1 hypothetical protein FisN_29Lh021 [Fistulifera solaris]